MMISRASCYIQTMRIILAALSALVPLCGQSLDWKVYGGGPDNIRYSPLRQVNRQNVRQLSVAWTFDTGDASPGSEMQCNPLIVDGTLYATTPKLRVIALDATSGALKWSFDPRTISKSVSRRSRGVTYWQQRVYFVAGHYLFSLDAKTGALVKDFGESGMVDLREGLGRPSKKSRSPPRRRDRCTRTC